MRPKLAVAFAVGISGAFLVLSSAQGIIPAWFFIVGVVAFGSGLVLAKEVYLEELGQTLK